MFKQIFKLTVVSVIWKRYKAAIISTLALFIYYWLVEKLHEDFLHYLSLQQSESNLASSFLLKWFLLLLGLSAYLIYNFWRKRPEKTPLPHWESKETATKVFRNKSKDKTKTAGPSQPDPFANIRQREKLRSKADFIVEQDKKN